MNNGKYRLYSKSQRYLSSEGCGYNDKFQAETRNVKIDWKKSLSRIMSASWSNDFNINVIYKNDNEENKNTNNDNSFETINEDDFWKLIDRIRCCDRDEGIMSKNSIKLPTLECRNVLSMIDTKYIPELNAAMSDVPILDGVDISEINNLLTHIICKGKIFYNGIIENPTVSLYLCDQFYPVYTWINEIVDQ